MPLQLPEQVLHSGPPATAASKGLTIALSQNLNGLAPVPQPHGRSRPPRGARGDLI
jgi:hypothetical protein